MMPNGTRLNPSPTSHRTISRKAGGNPPIDLAFRNDKCNPPKDRHCAQCDNERMHPESDNHAAIKQAAKVAAPMQIKIPRAHLPGEVVLRGPSGP